MILFNLISHFLCVYHWNSSTLLVSPYMYIVYTLIHFVELQDNYKSSTVKQNATGNTTVIEDIKLIAHSVLSILCSESNV